MRTPLTSTLTLAPVAAVSGSCCPPLDQLRHPPGPRVEPHLFQHAGRTRDDVERVSTCRHTRTHTHCLHVEWEQHAGRES